MPSDFFSEAMLNMYAVEGGGTNTFLLSNLPKNALGLISKKSRSSENLNLLYLIYEFKSLKYTMFMMSNVYEFTLLREDIMYREYVKPKL